MENLIQLTEKLGESYALLCSFVGFIPSLLQKYAQGKLTRSELFTVYMNQTRENQFYYFHMPKEEMLDNQRLFQKEFLFSDKVTHVINKHSELDEDKFSSLLEECIEDYLKSI